VTDVTGTNGSDEGSFTEVSKLLLDEPPLQIQPRLACAVGLNEAIVLQQIHYWLVKNAAKHRNVVNGHVWTYNSYRAWRDEAFPWWSVDTVKRAVQRLEAEGLLISMQPRQSDRSKWYRIDYERLAGIFHRSSVQSAPVSGRSAESRAPSVQSAPAHEGNLPPPMRAICTRPPVQFAPMQNRE
jgi:hypothetical protein